MDGKSLTIIAAAAMLVSFSTANATEPALLSNVELDTVTAGGAIIENDRHLATGKTTFREHLRRGMSNDHYSMQNYPSKEQKRVENNRLFCDGAKKGTDTVASVASFGSSPRIDISSLGHVPGK
jgi:hypothetical protein